MILDTQQQMAQASAAQVAPAGPSGPTGVMGAETGAKRAMEAKEQFLKMLVAQISNQSPTNPMDDKDMVSQLAQFSAIEQAIETNNKLEALEHAQQVTSKLNVAALIGKNAAVNTNNITVAGKGAASPVAFDLQGRAKNVTVRVLDGDNNLVRTLNYKELGAGVHSLNWDGTGNDKLPLPKGSYRSEISATNEEGTDVGVRHEIRGLIHKVDVDGGEPGLYIGDRRVSLREVSQISD